jgi:hypothetical protein
MGARLTQRLSLQTVTWARRIAAILIAFAVGITLLPIFWDLSLSFRLLPGSYSRGWTLFYLAPPLAVGALFFWGTPALMFNHIALRRSWHFVTYIAGGALIGVMGFIMMSEAFFAISESYEPIHWLFYPFIAVPSGLTGAFCAVAAWHVMAFRGWNSGKQG